MATLRQFNMKKNLLSLIVASALMALSLTVPSFAALAIGNKAPTFAAKASLAGKDFMFSLGKALKKGPVVYSISTLRRSLEAVT